MLASLAAIWSALSEGFKALGLLFGMIHDAQQKQAGVDEQQLADTKADDAAMRRVDQVSAQGQTDDQTLDDLKRGDF